MSPEAERYRRDTEERLARILQRVTPAWRNRIRREIANHGSVQAVPRSFWLSLSDTVDIPLAKEIASYTAVVYEDAVNSVEAQKEEPKGWLWKALGLAAAAAGVAAYIFGRRPANAPPVVPPLPPAPPSGSEPEDDDDWRADRRKRIEQAAADQAAARGRQIAIDYAESARKRLEKSIDEKAKDLNDLSDEGAAAEIEIRIEDATSSTVIDGVVVTNTTEATSEAQRQAARDILDAIDDEVRELWRVEKGEDGKPDEKVCPICKPLEATGPETWQDQFPIGPPCHLNCRCDLELVLSGGEAAPQPQAA